MIPKYINDIKIQVDGYVWDNVQTGKDLITNKFDNVICIDGMEGTGKSEFAFQWAIMQSDGKFKEKDVFYTADQFEEWIHQAKKGDVGVWDEFVLAGMSTDALTKMQNSIIKMFTIMRSKGLTVILVIPYFFMLRKYFAIARTRALVHIYANGLERGYMKFYNYQQKQWIYIYGQKTWLYNPKTIPSFTAHFKVWSDKFLNHDKINERKQQALKDITEELDYIKLTPKVVEYLIDYSNIDILVKKKDNATAYNTINKFKKDLERFNEKVQIKNLK